MSKKSNNTFLGKFGSKNGSVPSKYDPAPRLYDLDMEKVQIFELYVHRVT